MFKYAMSTAVHYSHSLVCFSLFLLTALVILSLLYMNAHPRVFRRIDATTIVERKHVQSCFVCDLSNNLYALNLYCMHFCH